MIRKPGIFGIVNITADSFSDGGKFLRPEDAIAHSRRMLADGADFIDLGPAASNPDAEPVSPATEIARLAPVLAALDASRPSISIDSYRTETQRFALDQRVGFVNDIHGFPDPSIYPALAKSDCRLIVMHAVQQLGTATREALPAREVWPRIEAFFRTRLADLERAGIARARLILDPGMGFFLSSLPETSLEILAGIGRLKRMFGLPVMVSVSRKSFLRRLVNRAAPESGPATLAAELFAAAQGADYLRTHDPAALRDALTVDAALRAVPR